MGIFSVFKRGLKKTRDEGITAQLDEVMDSYEKITPEFLMTLRKFLLWVMSECRPPRELSVI